MITIPTLVQIFCVLIMDSRDFFISIIAPDGTIQRDLLSIYSMTLNL